jgi:hypothetical protein
MEGHDDTEIGALHTLLQELLALLHLAVGARWRRRLDKHGAAGDGHHRARHVAALA